MGVSIPFEQGDVFRHEVKKYIRENDFVSIPFEQGDVFRQKKLLHVKLVMWSQSLSSRAMSFDYNLD